jgi:hypothetical protein
MGSTPGSASRTDPHNDPTDGPFVLVGSTEYTLEDAARLGLALADIAEKGAQPRRDSAESQKDRHEHEPRLEAPHGGGGFYSGRLGLATVK